MKQPEQARQCIVEVGDVYYASQCNRKRGHGPDGLYCKQHARMIAEGKPVSVPEDNQ